MSFFEIYGCFCVRIFLFLFPKKNLSFTLETKWSDDMRDYGNYNSPKHGTDYADVKLEYGDLSRTDLPLSVVALILPNPKDSKINIRNRISEFNTLT